MRRDLGREAEGCFKPWRPRHGALEGWRAMDGDGRGGAVRCGGLEVKEKCMECMKGGRSVRAMVGRLF